MRKPWQDIKMRYDKSIDKYLDVSPDEYKPKLAGLRLEEVIALQGWSMRDVQRAVRKVFGVPYHRLRICCKCRKPMEGNCNDLEMWHDIKQACDSLNIFWEGWKDLPELPDDDF